MSRIPDVSKIADGWKFAVILAVILIAGLGLRVAYISADAPVGFTRSQDVSTDPFAYTYFAKNKIDFGDANPFDDPRWIVYEKSTQTVASYIVYSILGTGRAQGNLTAGLLNLMAILLVALGIKNFGSRLGGLVFALLACVNFTLTMFARIPFLEASQNLWLAAAFFFFSKGEGKRWWYVAAGIAAAAAAFFGKMIALYAGGLFFVVWLFKYLSFSEDRKAILTNAVRFYAGYVAVAVIWFFFTYLPSASEVSAYYAEQGVGLYGTPDAFKGIGLFLYKVQNLLWERFYFSKLPFVTISAAVSGVAVIFIALDSIRKRRANGALVVGLVAMFVWLVFAYAALFPFNYRPLRYQTTLMFPMMAMGGVIVALMMGAINHKFSKSKKREEKSPIWIKGLVVGAWLAPLFCTVVMTLGRSSQSGSIHQTVLDNIYVLTFLFVGLGFALSWLIPLRVWRQRSLKRVASVVAMVFVVVYAVYHLSAFFSWANAREYTLVSADRDLGRILASNAVVSGSYASALTQENGLKCIHHQFGVETPDTAFFTKFPITHLVIDRGNEERARKDYPRLMSQAVPLTRFPIRGVIVNLYRISGASPNDLARGYTPSPYESAMAQYNRQQSDSTLMAIVDLGKSGYGSYSSELFLGETYSQSGAYTEAIPHLKSALAYSPFDTYASYSLGNAYLQASSAGNSSYRDSALVYLEFVLKRVPQDERLKAAVDALKRQTR